MMSKITEIVVDPGGDVRCVYTEAIDFACLGDVQIRRVSHVEPDERGQWSADLSAVGGPILGPFEKRSEALEAELTWLRLHALASPRGDRQPPPARCTE